MAPRTDRGGFAAVVQDVRLLRRGDATNEREAIRQRLTRLWEPVAELLHGASSKEKDRTHESFQRYCAAAAHRRVRQRQIRVIASGLVGLVATTPTVWLIVLAFDPTRPVALLAYLLTTLALTGPAWLALRSRRLLTTVVLACIAGLVCWAFWQRPARGTWWDPRIVLTSPDTDQQRLAAGVVLGAALTVLLIVIALLADLAQMLVARSRSGGGAGDVRAFDHLIAVVELLTDPPRSPGDDHRKRLEETVQTAKIGLLVMVRGSRPVGWRRRWRSRAHFRESKAAARRIIRELARPNPLSGLRKVDDQLRLTVVHCLIGICDDQLGDVHRMVEVPAQVVPGADGGQPRISTAARQRLQQILGMVLPLTILLLLMYFGFPMPGEVKTLLAAFCALVLVLGAFWLFFPDQDKFLTGLKNILSAVGSAIPLGGAADAARGDARLAEDTGDTPS